MAKKQRGENGEVIPTVAVPEGFDINIGREKGEGWVVKEEGNTVQGRLLGRYTFKGNDGKQRAYYQVKVQVATKILPVSEEEGVVMDVITCEVGAIVNVDESAALSDLETKADDGGVYDVWFVYKKKEKSKSGPGGFWPVHGPKLKMLRAPRKRRDAEDGDLPF